MHVRVDDETDLAVGQLSDRRDDLVGERSELVVDHDDAVVTDGQPDVAARSLEIVDAARDVVGGDLNVAEVTALRVGRHSGDQAEDSHGTEREGRGQRASHECSSSVERPRTATLTPGFESGTSPASPPPFGALGRGS